MNLDAILDEVQRLGVTLTVKGDRLLYQPASITPPELVTALKEHKQELLRTLTTNTPTNCWVLEEWRRTSIPEWRQTLKDGIEQHDIKKEEYARWMLGEMLNDPGREE